MSLTFLPDPGPAESYRSFLEGKISLAASSGFAVDPSEINPALKDFNLDIVRWAAAGGRRAIFAAFGLHKTAMQIEFMRLVGRHHPGKRLIVLPLGVRSEFMAEATERFTGDYAVDLRFIRSAAELDGGGPIYLTNYETVRDGKIDPTLFVAASLDEASVLRSFGSKTFQEFLPLFGDVPFPRVQILGAIDADHAGYGRLDGAALVFQVVPDQPVVIGRRRDDHRRPGDARR